MNIITFSKKAGVSVATVSRALNPKTAHMVKQETRRRIQDLAAQLNYIPHPGARVLRRSSAAPIAVLLRKKERIFLSEYYAQLLTGIIHASSERGQAVHTISFTPDSSDFNDQLNTAAVGCGGIIYLSEQLTLRRIIGLDRLRLPFVANAGSLPPGLDIDDLNIPVFGVDNITGGRLVTEHLIALGHKNIALLNGPTSERDAQMRRKGFESVMTEHGLSARSDWCFNEPFTFESGVAAAELIRPLLSEVTAVVCGSDELAMGLIRGLASNGINCPADVSVTGYDDALWAARHSPSVTTIQQPWMKMTNAAVQMVLDMRHGSVEAHPPSSVLFEPMLIERETTAPPAARIN